MARIIGRKKEMSELETLYASDKSEFVAIYGRRRVGKTFLVDETLKGRITFRHAGLSPVDGENNNNNLRSQLKHFHYSLRMQGVKSRCPKSWMEAFFLLSSHLDKIDDGSRQVVFLDELPWMDTPRSGFVTALEGFWNTWACHRDNLMLVVCGSANSWMLDNLVNNHGGLYGRTTYEIKLAPFTLQECEEYFASRNFRISRYDIVQSYMMLGGIPYYLGYMQPAFSLAQNIDRLFFADDAKLAYEYDRLFSSVFSNPEEMKHIVGLIGKNRTGLTRKDIIKSLGIESSGNVSKMLNALVASDFVKTYVPFGEKKSDLRYRLTDPFCIFQQKFITSRTSTDAEYWTHNVTSPKVNSWRGFAFEEVCFHHVRQIKNALGILGVASTQSAWNMRDEEGTEGTQIDMLIDRNDNIIDMCEMKFYNEKFTIDKSYHGKLVHRLNLLSANIPRRKTVHSVLVTTYGLNFNEYSGDFQNVVTLDDLFSK